MTSMRIHNFRELAELLGEKVGSGEMAVEEAADIYNADLSQEMLELALGMDNWTWLFLRKSDLPKASRTRTWDGPAARRRMVDDARNEDGRIDVSKASEGFTYVIGDSQTQGAYTSPFADMVNGEKRVVLAGVNAALARNNQVKGISDDERASGERFLRRQQARFDEGDDDMASLPMEGADHIRMRATPTHSALQAEWVNKDDLVLKNVAVAQAVEAIGHNLMLDATTLEQMRVLGNSKLKGIKSRFTHPGLSADGLGRFLGRTTGFWIDHQDGVPTLRGNMHFADVAKRSPEGDLPGYVMDRAREDPESFGMSAVLSVDPVWVLEDGTEIDARKNRKLPENSRYEIPVARVVEFHAADVVDEPAATRNGFFSRTTNMLASDLFGRIDDALTYYQISPGRAYEFFMAYFQARGVDGKAYALPHTIGDLKQAGQIVKMFSTEEIPMDEHEELEEVAAAEELPEDPLEDEGQKIYANIIEQVVTRVSAGLEEDSGREDHILEALTDIQADLAAIKNTLSVHSLAIATLQGDPVVTRKVGPDAIPASRIHSFSTAEVPGNLPMPTGMGRPGTTPGAKQPMATALQWAKMREGGEK